MMANFVSGGGRGKCNLPWQNGVSHHGRQQKAWSGGVKSYVTTMLIWGVDDDVY